LQPSGGRHITPRDAVVKAGLAEKVRRPSRRCGSQGGRGQTRAASLTTSSSEEEELPRPATRAAAKLSRPHKQVSPRQTKPLKRATSLRQPDPIAAHAPSTLAAEPHFAAGDGRGKVADSRVPPTRRRLARPKSAALHSADSASVQEFGVGDTVSVDGRGGTVLWDGRPQNNFVKVRWLDDGSDSCVIAVGKVKFAGKLRATAKAQAPEFPEGKVYTGFRNDDAQKDGFGVMRLKDGSVYNGQWKQDRREGHGTLFFEGGVFEGQWADGDAHGKGKTHFKNGDTFEGCYADNKKCGPGVYSWKDGAEEHGDYLGGFKQGWHQLTRGPDKWDLLYEKGGVVQARKNEGSFDAGDPPTGRPSTTVPSITANVSTSAASPESAECSPVKQPSQMTQSTSPRTSVSSSHRVLADAAVAKRPRSKTLSKSPRTSVTLQPPYTRSCLKAEAPEARKLVVRGPSKSPRTSVASVPDSDKAALKISPASEAVRPLKTSKSKTYKSPPTSVAPAGEAPSVKDVPPQLGALALDTEDMW